MFTFENKEELQEKITAAVEVAEKRAQSRLLPLDLEKLTDAVVSTPYGYAEGDGGGVAKSYRYRAETTCFNLAWYTQGSKKVVALSVYRGDAEKVAYGSSGYLTIHAGPEHKWEGFRRVFPDRARKIANWLKARKIRQAIQHLPKPPANLKIQEVLPDVGGIVRTTGSWTDYVGTPAGWIRVPSEKGNGKRTAWTLLARMGFPVPRRKADRVWSEELTAAVTLHVLGEV
ncbi:MAG: hypothetical protein GXY34_15375 [Syntrophomonadaceae bacterium]|nr:hypothetical protein [Syntrophomonadaceae bacterium]